MPLFNPYGDPLTGKAPAQPNQPPQPRRQILMSPEAAQRSIDMGMNQLASGTDYGPVRTPLQGLGRLSDAIFGTYHKQKGEKALQEHKRQKEDQAKQMMDAYWSGDMEGAVKSAGGMFSPDQAANFVMSQAASGPDEQWVVIDGPYGEPVQYEVNTGNMKAVPGGASGSPIAVVGPDGKPVLVPSNRAYGMTPYYKPSMSGRFETANGDVFEFGTPGGGMEKGTRKEVEGDLIVTQQQLSRLYQVRGSFDPEYLRVGGKVYAKWLKAKDQGWIPFMNTQLDPEEKQYLEGYSQFYRRAWSNANAYIKLITGAQMSEVEAQRIMRAMPNPGKDNPFGGMSPTEFQAVLDDVIYESELAQARHKYLLEKGFSEQQIADELNKDYGFVDDDGNPVKGREDIGGVSIDDMNQLISDDWKKNFVAAREQGLDVEAAKQQATGQTKARYGTAPKQVTGQPVQREIPPVADY